LGHRRLLENAPVESNRTFTRPRKRPHPAPTRGKARYSRMLVRNTNQARNSRTARPKNSVIILVDGAVDCPVEVPAWFMGLCGFLGDLPCWMPRGAVVGGKGNGCDWAPCFSHRLNGILSPHTFLALLSVVPVPLLLRSATARGHRKGSRPRCFSFHNASSRCHLAALS